MGDIARCSVGKTSDYYNEDLLYKLFGVNAELLIDHAWGWEPTTIADIKAYKPESNSIGSGQVLQYPYTFDKARLVVREMADMLALELVDKKLVTNQIVLTVGYDIENLKGESVRKSYHGEITIDRYGRSVPKHAHGTENIREYTSSTRKIIQAALALYDRIIDRKLLIRRMYLVANHIVNETDAPKPEQMQQLDLFTDYAAEQAKQEAEATQLAKEKSIQKAMLSIKKKYGKNAILKGMNLEDGATAKDRNGRIGGHKA